MKAAPALMMWTTEEPIPEDGASVQVIVRTRKANGEVIEKMIRSFQIGEYVCIGVVAPPRNEKKRMAQALEAIEKWQGNKEATH